MPHVASTCKCGTDVPLRSCPYKLISNDTDGVLAPQLQIGNINYRMIGLLIGRNHVPVAGSA